MYQQDWILREIENMIAMVARIVFKRNIVKYEIVDTSKYSQTDLIYRRILDLLRLGKINEAENLLFENIENTNLNYLQIAMEFYKCLNDLSDEDLENAKFTRVEIKEGFEDVLKIYNIDLPKFE